MDRKMKKPKVDIVTFLEKFFILEDGEPIKIEPWQKEHVFNPVFSDIDERGRRRFDLALIGLPKKNGKSTVAAGVACYMLLADGEVDPEVYSAAGDKDQARIVFSRMSKAVKRSPVLRNAVKVYRDAIERKDGGGVYRVLSADAPTAHGLNPSCVVFDELWNQPNRDLYDALTLSPARANPLNLIITYAGFDQRSLLYELYQEGLKKDDPRFYMFWSHSNLASWITQAYLNQQRRRLPPGVYQRLHQNMWVDPEGSFITRDDLKRCIDHNLRYRLQAEEGRVYVYAIDLGLVRDRTCRVIVSKGQEPELRLDSIRVWQGSREDPVLIADVEEDMEWARTTFHPSAFVCDPWQMQATIQKFRWMGTTEFTFSTSNLAKLSANLYYLVHNGLVKMPPDKELEDELLGLQCVQKSYGWRIDHEASGFSDRAIALGMGSLILSTMPGPIEGMLEICGVRDGAADISEFVNKVEDDMEDF